VSTNGVVHHIKSVSYPGNVVLTMVGCCCSCLYFMSFNLQEKKG